MSTLEDWDSFYVFLGSAAGILLGWQFVLITLIANRPAAGAPERAPTIVHFSATLLLAAFMLAPWEPATLAATMWGFLGLAGVIYAAVVTRRMHKQNHYRPEFEDWLFHSALPIAAYAILAASAVAAPFFERAALFAVAACGILLLIIGIHNAWDGVTYRIYVSRRSANEKNDSVD